MRRRISTWSSRLSWISTSSGPPTALEPVLTKYRFMTAIGAPRYIPTVLGWGKLEGA
jgi:hypothetical protein